ncbi:MAG: hypothetical protein M1818_006995 [Claussenomyces sp. TS43310]|nr:MAG: hypothetical protein M1818_006995 [Claussenomyces sp. TS43310]
MDYKNLPTPPTCVADFCLIPIGTPTASVSNEVAAVQRLMVASGLSHSMHSAGTTVEGSWDAVMRLIGQAHTLVHRSGVARVQTDIRAGTRTDKAQRFADKVAKVHAILAAEAEAAAPALVPANAAESTEPAAFPIDAEGNQGRLAGQGIAVSPSSTGPAGKVDASKGTWASIFKK